MDIKALIAANNARYKKATYKPNPLYQSKGVARRLVAPSAKSQYIRLENETGVPWFIIAVIHEREASQRWDRSLAQGDPWNRVSIHRPRGRGPFASFHEAGLDALTNCPPYAARWRDWSPGGALTLLEMYNGTGYALRGRPSPYIWSGTNQYVSGKYVEDGKYDPNTVDSQLGCAVLLKSMAEIDDSVSYEKYAPVEPMDQEGPSSGTTSQSQSPKAQPLPTTEEVIVPTTPGMQTSTIWGSILTAATTIIGYATDWKILAVVGVFIILAALIYLQLRKPDIKGWFT